MKKTFLIGLALVGALSMSAQQSVVTGVERNIKSSSPDYKKAMQDIQPALTNPETAENAQTWFVAGTAGFELFKDALLMNATGRTLSAPDQSAAASALMDGFNYYIHALPLDSVVNEKGKVKTKYSKDIVKKIKEQYEQLRNAGVMAWGNNDYDKAYDIWELYLTLPTNPVLGKNAPTAAIDTIQGELMWNQAIAMLLLKKNEEALKKLRQMEGYNFMPEDYYAYAMGAAQAINDDEAANEFARKGLEQPNGASNSGFIAQLINTELTAKNYPAAYELVNKALANTSEENGELRSQLYDIIGNINETEEKYDEAISNFQKAIAANNANAKAYFDYGRILYNNALKVDDSINEESERVAKADPMFKDAATYFEKAYELDDNMTNIPGILYRLYYRLGAGYEDKASYWENLQ